MQPTVTSLALALSLLVLPHVALKAQCTSFVPGPNSATLLGNVTLDGSGFVPPPPMDELAAYDLARGVPFQSNVVVS